MTDQTIRPGSRNMRRKLSTITALGVLAAGVLLVVGASTGQYDHNSKSLWEMEFPSIAMPSRDLELSFVARGKIDVVAVEPEQRVSKGQLLVQLDDRVQRQQTKLAELAALDTSTLDAAGARLDRAERELVRMEKAQREGGVNEREADDARTSHAIGLIELAGAQLEGRQNRVVYERERARLDEMRILSPIDGIVADIVREVGESVEELQVVLRVVNIDPLWLDVAIPAGFARIVQPGGEAVIRWRDLPDELEATGTILSVASVSDPASSTIRVRVETLNPTRIPGGQHVLVRFIQSDGDESEATAARSGPANSIP